MDHHPHELVIDPKDVIKFLNDFGYYNITAKQLKDFIIDLRRIIRAEQKQKLVLDEIANQQKISTEDNTDVDHKNNEKCSDQRVESKSSEHGQKTAHKSLHIRATISSKAKHSCTTCKKCTERNERHKTTSNQTEKPCFKCKSSTTSLSSYCDNCHKMYKAIDDERKCEWRRDSSESNEKINQKSKESGSKESIKGSKETTERSKSAGTTTTNVTSKQFIRPRIPKNDGTIRKSDPVALFQEYQRVWKKSKIPGENDHAKLRWAVREKMMGD